MVSGTPLFPAVGKKGAGLSSYNISQEIAIPSLINKLKHKMQVRGRLVFLLPFRPLSSSRANLVKWSKPPPAKYTKYFVRYCVILAVDVYWAEKGRVDGHLI
jgi:hypothetical protein